MIASLLLTVPFTLAPTPCNLFIVEYPGSSEKEGREDSNDIFAVEHKIFQPIDSDTGRPIGIVVQNPLTVVKVIDKATPGIHKALVTGENLSEVTLRWYRIDPTKRSEIEYFTITLRNVRIVTVETIMPMSFLPENESYRHMELVSFVYKEIEWDWIPSDPPPPPLPTGDSDENGRVDLRDFASLQRCIPLPSVGSAVCLFYFDFDLDRVITLDDYAEFTVKVTGP